MSLSLSIEELKSHLKICKEKCKYFRRQGKSYQRRHLYNQLAAAQDKKEGEAEQKILEIIQREKLEHSGGDLTLHWTSTRRGRV